MLRFHHLHAERVRADVRPGAVFNNHLLTPTHSIGPDISSQRSNQKLEIQNMNSMLAAEALVPSAVTSLPSAIAPILTIASVTDEMIEAFCDAILCGLPTNKILPASITDLKLAGSITANQLARIREARKEHQQNAEADRKTLMKLARSRRLKGARFNSAGRLIALRFADKIAARK